MPATTAMDIYLLQMSITPCLVVVVNNLPLGSPMCAVLKQNNNKAQESIRLREACGCKNYPTQ